MAKTFDEHIQCLARGGVATHLIQNPPDVDSVFAVAKAKDLPEVTFAAAFDDGTLVIGCDGPLPEALADLAQPITVSADEPTALPDDPALLDRLDAIEAAIASQAHTPDVASQLATLTEAIQTFDGPDTPPPPSAEAIAAAVVGAMPSAPALDPDALVAQLRGGMQPPVDLAPLDDKLTTMSEVLGALATAPGAAPAPEEDSADRFAALEDKLAAVDPATQLTRIEKLLTALHASTDGHAPATPGPVDLSGLAEPLDQIRSDLAALVAQAHAAPAEVDSPHVDPDAGAPVPDVDGVLDDMAAKLAVLLHLDAKLDGLCDQVTALGSAGSAMDGPDPEEKLHSRIKDGFDALGDQVQRLHDAWDDARTDADPAAPDAALADLRDTVLARLDALDQNVAEAPDLAPAFDDLRQALLERLDQLAAPLPQADPAAPVEADPDTPDVDDAADLPEGPEPPADLSALDQIRATLDAVLDRLPPVGPAAAEEDTQPTNATGDRLILSLATLADRFDAVSTRLMQPPAKDEVMFRSGAQDKSKRVAQALETALPGGPTDGLIPVTELRARLADLLADPSGAASASSAIPSGKDTA